MRSRPPRTCRAGRRLAPLERTDRRAGEQAARRHVAQRVGRDTSTPLARRLCRGPFNESDGLPGRESVIVKQPDMYFKARIPLMHRSASPRPDLGQPVSAWLTVVGVATECRQRIDNQSNEADPIVYIPHRQNPTLTNGMALIARTMPVPPVRVRHCARRCVPSIPIWRSSTSAPRRGDDQQRFSTGCSARCSACLR